MPGSRRPLPMVPGVPGSRRNPVPGPGPRWDGQTQQTADFMGSRRGRSSRQPLPASPGTRFCYGFVPFPGSVPGAWPLRSPVALQGGRGLGRLEGQASCSGPFAAFPASTAAGLGAWCWRRAPGRAAGPCQDHGGRVASRWRRAGPAEAGSLALCSHARARVQAACKWHHPLRTGPAWQGRAPFHLGRFTWNARRLMGQRPY